MILERTKNAKRNIIYGVINKIVLLAFPFIIRSFVIQYLGSEYLGLDSLFTSILQVLSLAELGFSSAVVYSMYKPIAEDDIHTICAILKFYRKVYRYVGLIIGVCGLCLTPFLPKLISGSHPEEINIYYLYLIYLANTVVSYWLFAYKSSLLEAYQRQDVVSKINTIISLCLSIAKITVLIITKNFYLFSIVVFVSNVINNITVNIAVNKMFPKITCSGELDKETKDDIKQKIKGLIIGKISGVTRNTFDSIFASIFMGLTITAIYNNYYYILNGVTGIMLVIYAAIVSGVGNSMVLDSAEKNYKDLECMNFLYMWIAGFCSICMLCIYQPFTELVFGKDMLLPFDAMLLFCVYFYALKLGDMLCAYTVATGLWWESRYKSLAETIGNFVLTYLLGKYYGVYGIIGSTIIISLSINFIWGTSIAFKYAFKNHTKIGYYKNHLFYAVTTIVVAFVTYGLCNIFNNNSFFTLCIRLLICVVISNILYFVIYRNTKIYKQTFKWVNDKFRLKEKIAKIIRVKN